MFREENAIKIAKIVKIFGLNGELTLRLYDTFPDEVDFEEPLFVYINGLLVPLFIHSFQKRGASKAVAIFDDIDSEYRAMEFVGAEIVTFENQDDSQEDDELYYEDFVGYSFTDLTSGKIGTITEFIDSEFNPLFISEINGEEVFLPANDDVIDEFSEENKTIQFSLPEGILDINN